MHVHFLSRSNHSDGTYRFIHARIKPNTASRFTPLRIFFIFLLDGRLGVTFCRRRSNICGCTRLESVNFGVGFRRTLLLRSLSDGVVFVRTWSISLLENRWSLAFRENSLPPLRIILQLSLRKTRCNVRLGNNSVEWRVVSYIEFDIEGFSVLFNITLLLQQTFLWMKKRIFLWFGVTIINLFLFLAQLSQKNITR